MDPADTTPSPSKGIDATDELPALDVAAYEAAQRAGESAPAEPEAAEAGRAPVPPDSELMLEVERWIVQKTEQLRGQQVALRAARRESNAGLARADALSRELGATTASLEALKERAGILEEELAREREAAQRRVAALDQAQHAASGLEQELSAARAAEARHSTALAASAALLQQRSEALEALQTSHAALLADQQRVATGLAELEGRLQGSELRQREAQRALEQHKHTAAELAQRRQDEARVHEQVAAERELLRAQLASCLEGLQNREAYRTMCEATIQELDEELHGATLRAEEHQARAEQLGVERADLASRLESAVRERDEARALQGAALAEQTSERDSSERSRRKLEGRLAELTAEHASVCAQVAALQASLTDSQRRAQEEALANRGAAERVAELEADIAARQKELAEAQLEVARGRASLKELTRALDRARARLAEQSRLLAERNSVVRTTAATHAELVALIAALRAQVAELSARLQGDSRLMRLEAMNAELRATVKKLHASVAERDVELQRATRTAGGGAAETQASILTRIDGGRNHSFVLRARTTIGRDPDNDLSLAMSSVSRHHAVLIPALRSAFLQDLGSTNGVLVNKHRVRCARLEHGDVITLGVARFRYTVAAVPLTAAGPDEAPARRRAQR
jgi:DNA repair exonuclease SbcCD ATPase subunit